jgi:hypothetical protein
MPDLRYAAQVHDSSMQVQKTQEKEFQWLNTAPSRAVDFVQMPQTSQHENVRSTHWRCVLPEVITIFDWLVHPSPLCAVTKGCNLQQPLVGAASSVLAVYILRLLPVIISDVCRQQGSQNNAAVSSYPIANECKDAALKRKNMHLLSLHKLYNLNLSKMNARWIPD